MVKWRFVLAHSLVCGSLCQLDIAGVPTERDALRRRCRGYGQARCRPRADSLHHAAARLFLPFDSFLLVLETKICVEIRFFSARVCAMRCDRLIHFSGRYDIKVYSSHLSLHGKTFDYKIPISHILRLFLLPHRDGRHMYFVVS